MPSISFIYFYLHMIEILYLFSPFTYFTTYIFNNSPVTFAYDPHI